MTGNEMISRHPQIITCVQCTCGRGWAEKGLMASSLLFRQKMTQAGWTIADGGNEWTVGAEGIQCPVCSGRMTEAEYKVKGL